MSCQLINIKNLLINFLKKEKKKKTELKIIKYIKYLIHFEQEHISKARTNHKKYKLKFKH